MEFLLHNEEGILFPPMQLTYQNGDRYFDRFRCLIPRGKSDSILGSGGAGVVHLARDEIMDRLVALKLLSQDLQSDPLARLDVIRETRQAMELTHPNIVRIHDFHEGPEGWGISMQYIDGLDIDKWRVENRSGGSSIIPYPVERIEDWIRQLCGALAYAHDDARMVHRDIKPRNLMLERRNRGGEKLYLTDFGITKKLATHTLMVSKLQTESSDEKSALGTLPYMSWQQLEDEPPSIYDDIYSIGITIYDLITGRPPYYEGGGELIRKQIKKGNPPSMAERLEAFALPNPGIPSAWEDVVRDCLRSDPEDRPQSVLEISERLGLMRGNPVSVGQDPGAMGMIAEKEELIRTLERDLGEVREAMEKGTGDFQTTLVSLEEKITGRDREVSQLRTRLEEERQGTQRERSEALAVWGESLRHKDEEIFALKGGREERDKELETALRTARESRTRLAEIEDSALTIEADTASRIDEARVALETAKSEKERALARAEKAEERARQIPSSTKKRQKPSRVPLALVSLLFLILGLGGGLISGRYFQRASDDGSVVASTTPESSQADFPEIAELAEPLPEEKSPVEAIVPVQPVAVDSISLLTEDFYRQFASSLRRRNVNFAGLEGSHTLTFRPDFENVSDKKVREALQNLSKEMIETGDHLLENSSAWALPELNGDLEIQYEGKSTKIPIKFDTKFMVLIGEFCRLPDETPDMGEIRVRAQSGNTKSMINLGVEYAKLQQADSSDSLANRLAFQWFFIAAELDDPVGQANAGQFLLDGIGVSPLPEKGIRYLQLAADQGETQAMCRLARYYEEGTHVEANEAKAHELFLKAAEAGNVNALGHLGMTSLDSQEPATRKKGIGWLEKAALQNHPYSTYVLGHAYLNGRGVGKNQELARKYLLKAAELGSPGAIEEVEKQGW